jgi:hypothetical protein
LPANIFARDDEIKINFVVCRGSVKRKGQGGRLNLIPNLEATPSCQKLRNEWFLPRAFRYILLLAAGAVIAWNLLELGANVGSLVA